VLDPTGRLSITGLAQHRRENGPKFRCFDPSEPHPESGARLDHLLGHDGLVIPDRGEDQGQPVEERLADRVVASVTYHRVEMAQQLELRDRLSNQDIGWRRTQ
jgi:hypothetical protein